MKEKILEKLDMEYEIFFLDMIKTTKENLFAKSGEIETKKSIVIFLNDEIRNFMTKYNSFKKGDFK